MSGHDVHQWLAIAAGIIGVALAIVTLGWGRWGRPGLLAVDRTILVALGAVLVAMSTGIVLLIEGSRPRDPLHLVYAAAALLVLPIARFGGAFAGRRALAVGIGAALLLTILVRLAQTG